MLNLHAPFRRAEPGDADALSELGAEVAPSNLHADGPVVADEGGRVTAALSGRPTPEAWRLEILTVRPDRLDELGPRLLAIADALAADEGLTEITLEAAALDPELRALLDREGFRPGEGGSTLLSRPVVPQG